MNLDIKVSEQGTVQIRGNEDSWPLVESDSAEALLQYCILQKLEEIRIGLIDIETNTKPVVVYSVSSDDVPDATFSAE